MAAQSSGSFSPTRERPKWLDDRWKDYSSRQKRGLFAKHSSADVADYNKNSNMHSSKLRKAQTLEVDGGKKLWGKVSNAVTVTAEDDLSFRAHRQLNKHKLSQQRRSEAQRVLEKLNQSQPLPFMRTAADQKGEEFFLTFLAGGSWLTKIAINNKPYKRFFYYDRQRKTICYDGSKKKSKHRAKYDSRDIIDVRRGYQTDVFNKCDGKYQENCCFSIIMAGKASPINLVSEDSDICELWVRGIRFLVYLNEKLQKQQDEKLWITDYFYAADASHDGQLEFDEVWALLQRMSVKMTKKDAKARFQKADLDNVQDAKGNITLNLEEFVHFYHDLCRREEVHELFDQFTGEPKGRFMSLQDVQSFLKDQQGLDYPESTVKSLIEKYEPSSIVRETGKLSVHGFQFLLNSHIMNARNHEHSEIYQDMTRPLNHYFISSSHNTYLIEDQLRGPSSIEGYIRALMAGCRCVELDCWDGENGNPVVYHGYTLTSKILFKDIIEDAIKHYAFHKTKYPLILSLENHCSVEQQKNMAAILKSSLADMLHTDSIDSDIKQLPSPEELKGKILVKCRKLALNASGEAETVAEEDSDDELNQTVCDDLEVSEQLQKKKKRSKMKLAKELSDLVTYVQSVSFHGFQQVKKHGKVYEMSSYSEKKALKLIDEDQTGDFNKHTNIQLCRIYPAGTRTDSSNYSPIDMWNVGCQLVSLNFQTPDRQMQLYRGKFLDNGSCGYVLKPAFMTDENSTYIPRGPYPDSWGRMYYIKVISGCHLPKPEGDANTSDLVDPYVKLEICGVPDDYNEFKTPAVKDNGLNPHWNASYEFHLSVPDLAMLRISVKDYDALMANEIIGQSCMPFTSLKTGYRHVKLESSEGVPLGPASILLLIQSQAMTKQEWLAYKPNSKHKAPIPRSTTGVKQMLGNSSLVNKSSSFESRCSDSDGKPHEE